MTDGKNPYLAPEAPIVESREEVPRLPVHAAISLFCRFASVFHLIAAGVLTSGFVRSSLRLGWKPVLFSAIGPGFRPVLILTLSLLGSAAYFVAGRRLGDQSGRSGLILCGSAIGMTYLAVWLYTWR